MRAPHSRGPRPRPRVRRATAEPGCLPAPNKPQKNAIDNLGAADIIPLTSGRRLPEGSGSASHVAPAVLVDGSDAHPSLKDQPTVNATRALAGTATRKPE